MARLQPCWTNRPGPYNDSNMTLALPIIDNGVHRPDFARGPRSLAAVRLLRISLTDRCNFRCIYCMPDAGMRFEHPDNILSSRDILTLARAARDIGIDHFKLTGGEPTVRRDLLEIVEAIAALQPTDLSLTTNGMLLDRLARPLRDAGLNRLTISWDSMQPDTLARIARGQARDGQRALKQFLRGLDAAQAAGFDRLKFNTVIIGGLNDHEAADFARLTIDNPWTVRFIEYMPLGDASLASEGEVHTVDSELIRKKIEAKLGPLAPVDRATEPGVGPANVFSLPGAKGRVGFISPMSRPFCETCNRLRLTATGELRSCLFDGGEVSVMDALRGNAGSDAIVDLFRRCVAMKPDVHSGRGNRPMSQIGG